jgi:Cu+-exporting ATPase
MEVDKEKAAGKSEYNGETYYFCSPGCKAAFDKDPEKYVGKSDAGSGHHQGTHH